MYVRFWLVAQNLYQPLLWHMRVGAVFALQVAVCFAYNNGDNGDDLIVRDDPIVLLLGDSMFVGQGIHAFLDQYPEESIGNPAESHDVVYNFGGSLGGDSCWRENEKCVSRLVADSLGMNMVNLACAAARSGDVLKQWEYAKARFGADLEGSTILLYVGANDSIELSKGGGIFNWSTAMKCFKTFLPFQRVDTETTSDWQTMETRIDRLLGTIIDEAPSSATIRVIGYPLQFRPIFGFVCWSIAAPCARAFDASMSRINETLRAVTATYTSKAPNVQFVDIDDANLLPYGVCSVSHQHVRDFTLDLRGGLYNVRVSPSSFHPKEEAHIAIAGRILESLPRRR